MGNREDSDPMMNITIKLPDELVRQAQAAGILTDDQVANLLQTELDRRQRQQVLFADMQKLQSLQPSLTPSEIETELTAFRQARAANHHSDT
jgi:hypothetical protein